MKWDGVEVKCPVCECDGVLREGVLGICLECGHTFNLNDYSEEKKKNGD